MTVAWQTAKLGEVCEFLNGLWKGERPPFVKAGVIRNTNFSTDGALDYSDIAYLDVEERKLEKRRLQNGDIILEKSGGGPKQPVGRVALFDKMEGVFSFSNFTSALRVRDSTQLDFRFLHWFLHWIYVSGKTAAIQSHSTGIRNLNGDAYKAIEIAFPKPVEQKRIVAILDHAFDVIKRAKTITDANLSNTREAFVSYVDNILATRSGNWTKTTLDQLAENRDSMRVPTTKRHRKPGSYAYYGASGIVDYVSEYIFEGDHLLISEDGANLLARSSPIAFAATGKYWVNNHAHILRFESIWTQRFVEYFINSIKIDQYVTGAAQPKLTQQALNRIPIAIPVEIDEQQAVVQSFASLSEATDELGMIYGKKGSALDSLRVSLLSSAFAGQL